MDTQSPTERTLTHNDYARLTRVAPLSERDAYQGDKEHAIGQRPPRSDASAGFTFVKVTARREHVDALTDMLRARNARLHDVELQGQRAILRARIPLAGLTGFQEAVSCLTVQSARVFAWPLRDDAASGTAADVGVGPARDEAVAQVEGIVFQPEPAGDYVT